MTSEQEKWLAFTCHLGGALGAILFANLGFLVPLIIWLMKREESLHVDHHGKEALNFQLNMLLLGLALYLVLSLLRGSLFRPFDILQWHNLPWFSALLILNLVLSIVGGIEAYNGKKYWYPFIVRIVR